MNREFSPRSCTVATYPLIWSCQGHGHVGD